MRASHVASQAVVHQLLVGVIRYVRAFEAITEGAAQIMGGEGDFRCFNYPTHVFPYLYEIPVLAVTRKNEIALRRFLSP